MILMETQKEFCFHGMGIVELNFGTYAMVNTEYIGILFIFPYLMDFVSHADYENSCELLFGYEKNWKIINRSD